MSPSSDSNSAGTIPETLTWYVAWGMVLLLSPPVARSSPGEFATAPTLGLHQLHLVGTGDDDLGVRREVEVGIAVLVVHRVEDHPHGVHPGALLVVGPDDHPG